jgi:predicted Zn-dependent peptidase
MEIIGTASIIKDISRDQLISWYEKVFNPKNMQLVLAGNFEPQDAIETIEKYFGKIKKNSSHKFAINDLKYSDQSLKTQVDSKEDKAIGIISFPAIHSGPEYEEEGYLATLLKSILVNYRSSILFSRLRKKEGLIYSVSGSTSLNLESKGLFDIIFTTSDKQMSKVYEIIFEELDKLYKDGFTEQDLEIGIKGGNNKLKMGYSSVSSIINWYKNRLFWLGKVRTIDEVIEMREGITLEQLNKIMRKILARDQMNIISRVKEEKTEEKLKETFNRIEVSTV